MVLLATNIIEKMTKIAMFNQVGNSTPLYEENSTIVESNTTMVVKIKMKISEVFLLRLRWRYNYIIFFPSLYGIESVVHNVIICIRSAYPISLGYRNNNNMNINPIKSNP